MNEEILEEQEENTESQDKSTKKAEGAGQYENHSFENISIKIYSTLIGGAISGKKLKSIKKSHTESTSSLL